MLKNVKGFSLIELMTVVAIIAILSVIAVPSYQGFQARARQKEGFNLLNGYYAAAIATRTEFGSFAGNLVGTGYAPVGELTYRLSSPDNGTNFATVTPFNNDDACTSTLAACNCSGNCGNFKTWIEMPAGVVGGSIGPSDPSAIACAMGPMAMANYNFIVGVGGVISTRASAQDIYYMDENKTIQMCSDGTK